MRPVLRLAAGASRLDRLSVGGLEIDRPSRTVRVAGRPVALSAKEFEQFELLVVLAAESQRVQEGRAPA